MKKISSASIDELKRVVSIVDVVDGYTKLTSKGNTFFGLCPFHTEKTGSLSVNSHLGLYHCFGCGASGDTIGFIQEIDNVSFVDAVETLANQYRVTLFYDEDNTGSPSVRQPVERESTDIPVATLRAALECARKYYSVCLTDTIRDYFIDRGIDVTIMEKYQLGFSPNDTGVINCLTHNGFSTDVILAAGIGYVSKTTNTVKDRMANRVVFPITDTVGRPVAFAGRVNPFNLAMSDGVKYVNTPNTSLYAKMTHLYGVSETKKLAQTTRRLCVCEGYFDVLALASKGVPAVAVCGTTLSGAHINTINRLLHSDYTYQVTLFFDNDQPGCKATNKVIDLLLDDHQDVMDCYTSVYYPNNMSECDPADIASGNTKLLHKLLSDSLPVINWRVHDKINNSHNIFNPGQRMLIAKNLSVTLAKINNKYVRCSHITNLAWQLQIPEADIVDLVQSVKIKGKTMTESSVSPATVFDEILATSAINPRVNYEKNITFLTLKYPHIFKGHYEDSNIMFSHPVFNNIEKTLTRVGGVETWQTFPSQTDWLYYIADNSDGMVPREVLTALVTLPDPGDVDMYMVDGFIANVMQGFECKEIIEELELELKKTPPHSSEYESMVKDIERFRVFLEDLRNIVRNMYAERKRESQGK